MKSKLSRFAVPYVVWMAIFVVAPIVIMVVYAFAGSEGGFTLDNFVQMGGYAAVFGRSFKLALIATAICLLLRGQEGGRRAARHSGHYRTQYEGHAGDNGRWDIDQTHKIDQAIHQVGGR